MVSVDVVTCGCGGVYVVCVDVVCGSGVADEDADADVDVDVSFCGALTQPAINNNAINAAMMAIRWHDRDYVYGHILKY